MMAPRVCPFCGGTGKKNKEHVWPQWLHKTEAAKWLLSDDHGERLLNDHSVIETGPDGRYREAAFAMGHWSVRLPNVTVRVCSDCNSQWMSKLETDVGKKIGPLIFDGLPIKLEPSAQQLLGLWACKTFMTYALTRPPQSNPFTPEDYGVVREGRVLPVGVGIWVMHVNSRLAHVGLKLTTGSIYPVGFLLDEHPDNSAMGMLAAGGLVFLLTKFPEPADSVLSPPDADPSLVHDLRLPRGEISFETPILDEDFMDSVLAWLEMPYAFSLPSAVGMTPDDVSFLAGQFIQGMPIRAVQNFSADEQPSPDLAAATKHEDEANAAAHQLVALDDVPGAALALTHAGRNHFNLGDFYGAARLLQRAHELPGGHLEEDPEAAYRIGQCFWNLQDAAGVHWYRRAIELGLDDNKPRFGLADCLLWAGDYSESLHMLEQIEPTSTREEVILNVAVAALGHIVHERGITTQQRTAPHITEDIPQEELEALIADTDAIHRQIWACLELPEELTSAFILARAWFGDHPFGWLQGAMVFEEIGLQHLVDEYLVLGLERIPVLYPSARELARSWKREGGPFSTVGASLERVLNDLEKTNNESSS